MRTNLRRNRFCGAMTAGLGTSRRRDLRSRRNVSQSCEIGFACIERLEDRTLLSAQFDLGFAIGGSGTDTAEHVATDDVGNIYVSGHFNGTVDFDPSAAGEAFLTVDPSDAETSVYTAKFDAAGNFLWVLPSVHLATPVSAGFVLVTEKRINPVTTTNSEEWLVSLNAETRVEQWSTQIGSSFALIQSVVAQDGSIYLEGVESNGQDFIEKLNCQRRRGLGRESTKLLNRSK